MHLFYMCVCCVFVHECVHTHMHVFVRKFVLLITVNAGCLIYGNYYIKQYKPSLQAPTAMAALANGIMQ